MLICFSSLDALVAQIVLYLKQCLLWGQHQYYSQTFLAFQMQTAFCFKAIRNRHGEVFPLLGFQWCLQQWICSLSLGQYWTSDPEQKNAHEFLTIFVKVCIRDMLVLPKCGAQGRWSFQGPSILARKVLLSLHLITRLPHCSFSRYFSCPPLCSTLIPSSQPFLLKTLFLPYFSHSLPFSFTATSLLKIKFSQEVHSTLS